MKLVKKLVIWSALSIALQTCIYLVIDTYYGKSLLNTNAKEVKIDDEEKPIKNLKINIPSDAKKIQASFDGKYISYYSKNKLNIVNTYNGTKHLVEPEHDSEQIYNKWMPDTNSMVLCEKDPDNKRKVSIFNYDAENNDKQAATDTNNRNVVLSLNNSTDTIKDMAMSSTMGIMYIKILKTNMKNDIFNIDVNGNVVPIFNSRNIGEINTFSRSPNLIYEDNINGLIKVTNSKSIIYNKCLLGTDSNDNLYAGILSGNKISKLLYGNMEKSITQWNYINFQQPVSKDNIIITNSGKVYIKNPQDGSILDKQQNKKIYYKGTLLKVTDTEILYVEDGILQRKAQS